MTLLLWIHAVAIALWKLPVAIPSALSNTLLKATPPTHLDVRVHPPKHEWVYILEADERMTPELFAECEKVSQNLDYIGYYVAERVMFMNRWIRYSTQYPRYQMRLFRHGKVWFTDYGHTEREVCDGATSF